MEQFYDEIKNLYNKISNKNITQLLQYEKEAEKLYYKIIEKINVKSILKYIIKEKKLDKRVVPQIFIKLIRGETVSKIKSSVENNFKKGGRKRKTTKKRKRSSRKRSSRKGGSRKRNYRKKSSRKKSLRKGGSGKGQQPDIENQYTDSDDSDDGSRLNVVIERLPDSDDDDTNNAPQLRKLRELGELHNFQRLSDDDDSQDVPSLSFGNIYPDDSESYHDNPFLGYNPFYRRRDEYLALGFTQNELYVLIRLWDDTSAIGDEREREREYYRRIRSVLPPMLQRIEAETGTNPLQNRRAANHNAANHNPVILSQNFCKTFFTACAIYAFIICIILFNDDLF
jgi:hypothetical protein